MDAPRFVNLGTAAEPFWQRASMHCKCCGASSSAQHCEDCTATLGRQIMGLLGKRLVPLQCVLPPEDARILYANRWNLYEV